MTNVLAFSKGGIDLRSGSEGFTAIGLILDAAKAIENYCLPSFDWLQQTWIETFG